MEIPKEINIHPTQIDTSNVQQLKVAWTYHAGGVDTAAHSQIQCNPIIINGILYGTSPQLKLFALDAATGQEKWAFNPFETSPGEKGVNFNLNSNRGVAYWTDGESDERIFYTAGPYLRAVNARTGKAIDSFGLKGKVDLRAGLGVDAHDFFVTATSASTVYKTCYWLVRGYRKEWMQHRDYPRVNVRTGKREWMFIPYPGLVKPVTIPGTMRMPGKRQEGQITGWHDRGSKPGLPIYRRIILGFHGGKRTDPIFFTGPRSAGCGTGKRIWHSIYSS
jgi:quinoprotein glucose dehydrogenase